MKSITVLNSKGAIHYCYPTTDEEKEYTETVTEKETVHNGEKYILVASKNEALKKSIKDMLEF